jgi:hypothetical protein
MSQENQSKLSVKEFSLVEALNNSNGKSSISALVGFACCIVGCLGFITGTVCVVISKENSSDLLLNSIAMTTLGTGMLVTKKIKSNPTETVQQ